MQLHDKAEQNKSQPDAPAKIAAKMPNPTKTFHILQPKQTILKQKEAEGILTEFNISLAQLPKIKVTDPGLPQGANVGDVIKVERKDEEGKVTPYYRVVIL